MVAIGVDLGGTNIKAALLHKEGGILHKVSLPTEADRGKEHVFDRISKAIRQLPWASGPEPVGIGIGTPGMVTLDRKTVKHPPNLPGWEIVELAEEIQKRTDFRCIIENDANLAALGSSRYGAGTLFSSMILITLGTGVGGGIIYNRELYRGETGAASELGHVIIDYDGPASNSPARGGIEAYLGQRFLSNIGLECIRKNPENPLYKRFHNNDQKLEPVDLFEAAENQNELAIEILRSSGEKLGYAIVNYIHILDIRKIVVSGGVANAGRWLLDPARKAALDRLLPPFREGFELIPEPLGNDAALYGASSLAFEHL